MKKPRLIYLCNALDEVICAERGIRTDSPAATKKVFDVCRAIRTTGASVLVLSMGRGRQSGSGALHHTKVARVQGILVFYLPFLELPILTHIWSAVAIIVALLTLRRRSQGAVLLAYNRTIHCWPAIEVAGKLGFRCFLDLEDGYVRDTSSSIRSFVARFLRTRFDARCHDGALLAAEVLAKEYAGSRWNVCYGVAGATGPSKSMVSSRELVIHLGGTLQEDTGANLLADAIRELRAREGGARLEIRFVVTGVGSSSRVLSELAEESGWPRVNFLGRVDRATYEKVLQEAHVGLALKLRSGVLGETTFPSKVIEIASAGMLLVTTRVSDVPELFCEDGAIYLEDESPLALANLFEQLASRRHELSVIAQRGAERVRRQCEPERVGQALVSFFGLEKVKRVA